MDSGKQSASLSASMARGSFRPRAFGELLPFRETVGLGVGDGSQPSPFARSCTRRFALAAHCRLLSFAVFPLDFNTRSPVLCSP